jgi:hypothetical protein
MSREIKFRAWNESVKKMTHFSGPLLTGDWEDKKGIFFQAEPNELYLSSYSDPMQYTGLKDRNGVEIYENDRLKHPEFDEPFVVEWNNEDARFDSPGCVSEWSSCEVVGNIHEHE